MAHLRCSRQIGQTGEKKQVAKQAAVLLKFCFCFIVDNTCQALLADQLESYGMAAGFGKLYTKNTITNLKSYEIYIKMQYIVISSNLTLTAVGRLIGLAHSADVTRSINSAANGLKLSLRSLPSAIVRKQRNCKQQLN